MKNKMYLLAVVLVAMSSQARAEGEFKLESKADTKITGKAEIYKFLSKKGPMDLSELSATFKGKKSDCNSGQLTQPEDSTESALVRSGYHVVEISNFRLGYVLMHPAGMVNLAPSKMYGLKFDLSYGEDEKSAPIAKVSKFCKAD